MARRQPAGCSLTVATCRSTVPLLGRDVLVLPKVIVAKVRACPYSCSLPDKSEPIDARTPALHADRNSPSASVLPHPRRHSTDVGVLV